MNAITIEEQREQLFRALAVLHVVRLALTSKTEGFDPDLCDTALRVVHQLIDDVAAQLERHATATAMQGLGAPFGGGAS